MKLLLYCQHVLGLGHFFRTLEICKALNSHQVTLITGGSRPDVVLPDHVHEVSLPVLMMDPDFSGLHAAKEDETIDRVKEKRRQTILNHFEKIRPDILLVELYPFGRKAFEFELLPLLEKIRSVYPSRTRVVCSLRDILVEKDNAEKYETRVVQRLNTYFDAVLIHSEPEIVSLEETFSKTSEIDVPVYYTGFVTSKPGAGDRRAVRTQMNLEPDDCYVVASAGGGRVGAPLLLAVVSAFKRLKLRHHCKLSILTGPYIEKNDFERIKQHAAGADISVQRFSSDFIAHLAACDLSISMAGYNTCMNLLATGANAIVLPFSQNREQRMRAEKFKQKADIYILEDQELEPSALSRIMTKKLTADNPFFAGVNLDGAKFTAHWLENAWERK